MVRLTLKDLERIRLNNITSTSRNADVLQKEFGKIVSEMEIAFDDDFQRWMVSL